MFRVPRPLVEAAATRTSSLDSHTSTPLVTGAAAQTGAAPVPPITLREAGPTENALRAARAIEVQCVEELAAIIDKAAGIKDLIGDYNNLVQRFEDEHELRLRLQVDLRLMTAKRDQLAAELLEASNDAADLRGLKDRLSAALMDLREASTTAYKTGRVDALAFVTAGNVLSESNK